jgi:hypothetical protein
MQHCYNIYQYLLQKQARGHSPLFLKPIKGAALKKLVIFVLVWYCIVRIFYCNTHI